MTAISRLLPLLLAGTVLVAPARPALADGMPLRDGRFDGEVITLALTPGQIRDLDAARAWWREYTASGERPTSVVPDVVLRGLVLTRAQRELIREVAGVSPKSLTLYETRDGADEPLA